MNKISYNVQTQLGARHVRGRIKRPRFIKIYEHPTFWYKIMFLLVQFRRVALLL